MEGDNGFIAKKIKFSEGENMAYEGDMRSIEEDECVKEEDDADQDPEREGEGLEYEFSGEFLICPHPGCNKHFQSRWSMTRHFRTHTGEKVVITLSCYPMQLKSNYIIHAIYKSRFVALFRIALKNLYKNAP